MSAPRIVSASRPTTTIESARFDASLRQKRSSVLNPVVSGAIDRREKIIETAAITTRSSMRVTSQFAKTR